MMMLIEIPFVFRFSLVECHHLYSGESELKWKTFYFARFFFDLERGRCQSVVIFIPIWNWFNFVSSHHYVSLQTFLSNEARKNSSAPSSTLTLMIELAFRLLAPCLCKASLFRNKIRKVFRFFLAFQFQPSSIQRTWKSISAWIIAQLGRDVFSYAMTCKSKFLWDFTGLLFILFISQFSDHQQH